MKNNDSSIAVQLRLRQSPPKIFAGVDYKNFKEKLERISEIIDQCGIEHIVCQDIMHEILAEMKQKEKSPKRISLKFWSKVREKASLLTRVAVARQLTQESLRSFSARLADSHLLQNFCKINLLEGVKIPSKSTIERFEKCVSLETMQKIFNLVEQTAIDREDNKLELKEGLKSDHIYSDSFCLESHIHFPTDWVLLIDATRTLMKGVKLIRKQGLVNRMSSPDEFIRGMNKLGIQMTQARRVRDSKKKQKKVLRLMKRSMKMIENHAQKHRDLLASEWQKTELSENEKNRIIKRLDNVLTQLPQAISQAHERIIGGRLVANEKKILSFYDQSAQVILRGKANAQVEFGNSFFIAENEQGFIVDWDLWKDRVPSDVEKLIQSLDRMKRESRPAPKSITGDRGFWSKKMKQVLLDENIQNHICPRPVKELEEKLLDELFCIHQRRRAQTEGRISILKYCFADIAGRSQDFSVRKLQMSWGILAHNLWILSRLPKSEEKPQEKTA
jgi:hypothetical protein